MKAISNFHTHTRLCHHAKGSINDYVEQAVIEGASALGFSDHCPFSDDFFDIWPDIRMTTKEALEEYIPEIQAAKESAEIPVFLGYECEWDSLYGSWYQDLREQYQADYLVLGPHWVNNGTEHLYIPRQDSPTLLNLYTDQTIEGMRSGYFDFVAHPDLFMMGYKEWNEQTKACSQAIIDAASDLDIPLEINGLGIVREPNSTKRGMRYCYPYIEFWEMVAQSNVRVVCNSDAHNPQDVIINAWRARDFASRFGIEPIDFTIEK